MKESSQGTTYNISDDLETWARLRIDLWTPEQVKAIEDELARRVRDFHGERIAFRAKANS